MMISPTNETPTRLSHYIIITAMVAVSTLIVGVALIWAYYKM